MEISMPGLLAATAKSLVFGLLLGALYDIIRISRILLGVSGYSSKQYFTKVYSRGITDLFSRRPGKTFSAVYLALTDVLFFAAAGILFVVFLFCFNYGIFRWFILFGTAAGFIAYYFSLGKLVILLSGAVCSALKLAVNVAFTPLILFARVTGKLFCKYTVRFIKSIRSHIDKCRNTRYTVKCIKKLDKFFNIG